MLHLPRFSMPGFEHRRKVALVTTLGLAAIAACDTKTSPELPSFIIFLTDDLGYGDLACYGNPINSTPNMDLFASQGATLTNCHSAGTVCSPSRAGILTGRNPYRSGFHYIAGGKSFLKDEEITIAELLKQKDYQTGFFGKWHLSNLGDSVFPNPGDQGFDYWLATSVNAFEGPENPMHFIRNGAKTGTMEGWYCDIIVRESLEWLSRRDKTKPFLLVVSTHEPHTPVDPPDSLSEPYLNPELLPLIKATNYGGVDREGIYNQEKAAQYYGTIKQLDNAFGRFINEIDSLGLKDNTLVFLTSDNGPEHPVNFEESLGTWSDTIRDVCYGTPGPFRGMKRYPYEGGHRVPGLVRWPKSIPAGTLSDQLVVGTDLLPIFCQMAGVEVPSDRKIDGEPVFKAFLGKDPMRKQPYLWVFPTHEDTYRRMPHMAMRDQNYVITGYFPAKKDDEKIIPWMKQSIPETFQLFDIVKDPGQTTDLSESLKDMSSKLSSEMIRLWLDIRQEYIHCVNSN
jgi:arylsulfatase A